MYHVTNIPECDKEPKWTEIKLSVADAEEYDGKLIGLPVAFFTTTQYDGGLPTASPYPRDGRSGDLHWRVAMPFNPNEYKIFEMASTLIGRKQVHLLCLDKADNYTRHFEKVLVEILEERNLEVESDKFDEYFPNGGANDSKTNLWVNVCFITPVKIGVNASWDTVKKFVANPGRRKEFSRDLENVDLINDWGIKQLNHLKQGSRRDELKKKWEASIEQLRLISLITKLAMKWWN